MENTPQDILEKIKAIKDSLPTKQRRLCNYILANYKTIGMATVAELAELAGIGTTTVMRLVAALDYKTYNHFKKDLFSVTVLQENSSYQNLKYALGQQNQDNLSNNLAYTGSELISVIQNMLTEYNLQQFDEAVDLMLNAKHVQVLALRSSKAAAYYAEYSFQPILSEKIVQLSNDPDYLMDRISQLEEGDVLFLICNWPSSVFSVNAAKLCHEMGIPIILITNTTANPIAKICRVMLDTNAVSSPCLLSPSLLIIEALSLELARRMPPESTQSVERLEKMLKENDLLVW